MSGQIKIDQNAKEKILYFNSFSFDSSDNEM